MVSRSLTRETQAMGTVLKMLPVAARREQGASGAHGAPAGAGSRLEPRRVRLHETLFYSCRMLTHGAKQACTRDAAWPYLLSLRGACANGVAADQTGRPWVGEPDLGPGHILSRPGGLAGAWSCGKEEAGEAGQMGPVVTTEKRAGGSRTLLHGLFAGSRRGLLVPVLTCEGDGNARGQTALEGSGFPADSQTSGEWGLAMSALLSTGASSL